MQCKVCGREAGNPEANFCDYCGSSFHEENRRIDVLTASEQETKQTTENTAGIGVTEQDRIPVWKFLVIMLLPFLPGVGIFLFLGIVIYWSASMKIQDSRKSFARALLIFSVVILLLLIPVMDELLRLAETMQ